MYHDLEVCKRYPPDPDPIVITNPATVTLDQLNEVLNPTPPVPVCTFLSSLNSDYDFQCTDICSPPSTVVKSNVFAVNKRSNQNSQENVS